MRALVVLIAMFSVSTLAWSAGAGSTISFDERLEATNPAGGSNLPTKITTQGFEFNSAAGFELVGSSNKQLYSCPGCETAIMTEGGVATFRLAWFRAAIAPFGPPITGNETIKLVGCYPVLELGVDPECVETELPISTSWTFYDQLSEDAGWQNLHTLKIVSNEGMIIGLDDISMSSSVKLLDIDVLPNDPDNKIFPNKGGKFPVNIYGDSSFDTLQIDYRTVKLGLGQASPAGTPANGFYMRAEFWTQETGIFCNDTHVTLTGETYSGQGFQGTDSIDATDCVNGGCHPY